MAIVTILGTRDHCGRSPVKGYPRHLHVNPNEHASVISVLLHYALRTSAVFFNWLYIYRSIFLQSIIAISSRIVPPVLVSSPPLIVTLVSYHFFFAKQNSRVRDCTSAHFVSFFLFLVHISFTGCFCCSYAIHSLACHCLLLILFSTYRT